MIEKLKVDRFLTLPGFDQSPPPVDPTFPANFVRAMSRTYNIEESDSSGPWNNKVKTSQISTGRHAVKDHRSFKWLPWVLGKVSCTKLEAGTDVLTGTMSGCWLTIFTVAGVRYAGHIGTYGGPATPQTLQAQAAWRNAVNANLIVPVAAFNPVGAGLPGNAALNLKGEGAEFYGAYKANGTMYTVVLTVKGNGGNVRRIAKVVQMPTTQDVGAF